MRISLGILAHNESGVIERTLDALSQQTLLTDLNEGLTRLEIICVPNGCSDDTATLARQGLASLAERWNDPRIVTKTCELDRAGKPNAWNEFVHRLADQSADLLIVMDADITLLDRANLTQLVGTLRRSPRSYAAVGRPIKRIARDRSPSVIERLSLAMSDLAAAGPPGLNGGLYCGIGSVLRRIWLPRELLTEDGFIKAMLVTDFFTRPDCSDRLVRAADAVYDFEPYLKPYGLFCHERRLVLGSAVNSILYDRLWSNNDDSDAGAYAKRMWERDSNWFERMVDEHLRRRAWWAMPHGMFQGVLTKRLRKLRLLRISRIAAVLPAAVAGTLFEIPVLFAANAHLKRKKFIW